MLLDLHSGHSSQRFVCRHLDVEASIKYSCNVEICMNAKHVGSVVTLTATFTDEDTGDNFDPDTVNFVILTPGGVETAYDAGAAVETGVYEYELVLEEEPTDDLGGYYWRVYGILSGNYCGADEGFIRMRASDFTNPLLTP